MMTMTVTESIITIGMIILGTVFTRFIPYLIFPAGKETPPFVRYLGKVLPAAVIGMLVIYCFKNMDLTSVPHGIPEILASLIVILVHKWRKNTLISIAAGTVAYMLLIHII